MMRMREWNHSNINLFEIEPLRLLPLVSPWGCAMYRYLPGESLVCVMLHMMATDLYKNKLKLKLFSPNSRGYLKNHCTNTRLVCTHQNAFFMLNLNMVMKIWISKIFEKVDKFPPVVCTRHDPRRERVRQSHKSWVSVT